MAEIENRGLGYFLLIVAVVVTPTAISLGWYQLTKNPHLRPLAITHEALRAYAGGGETVEITARIDWAQSGSPAARQELSHALFRAFAAKGVELNIVVTEGAPATRVTYLVGKSVIGPFSPSRAAEGINAAVQAYRMKVPVGSDE